MCLLHLGAVYSLMLLPKAKPLTRRWGKFCRRPLCPGHVAGAGGAREVAALPQSALLSLKRVLTPKCAVLHP